MRRVMRAEMRRMRGRRLGIVVGVFGRLNVSRG